MKTILKLHKQKFDSKLKQQKGWWWEIQFNVSFAKQSKPSYWLTNNTLYAKQESALLAIERACKRFNITIDEEIED